MSRFSRAAPSAVPLILGAALAAVAFGAEGSTELTRTSVTGVALVLASGAVIAAAILWARPGRTHGTTTLTLFVLLALLTAASVLWSIVPELTYVEAGRTFGYVAVFGAAVAGARLAPRAAPRLLVGLLVGAVVPVTYGLASRVWPAALAQNEVSNRLGQPFDYWNAVGCAAAMAVPICLWLGSRRVGNPLMRVLAYPAMGVSVLAILLTQSRGAAAAAAVGAVAWFVLVPLRLRSLPVLLVPVGAAAAVGAWALSKDPFSKSLQPMAAKEAVAGDFGALVLLMIVLLLLVGAAVNTGVERRAPSARMRRRVGIAAVALACLLPLAAFTSVAFSERGIGDRIHELTSETKVAPQEGGGRVFAASSSRGKYWREAFRVFNDRPLEGVGAGAFEKARLRHRTDASVTQHAHGFIPQTMADLGMLGLVVTTLLFLAWVLSALSATALVPRRLMRREGDATPLPRRDWDPERVALVTLALVPLVFGIQSLLDWTWFIQGNAVMALIPAGYLAGRGPLGEGANGPAAAEASEPRRWRPAGGRIVAALAALATAALVAWAVWQPEASDRATNQALALLDEKKFDQALAKTDDAEKLNPLTPDPLLVRASIDTAANRENDAQQNLERAVLLFPGDPQTWYRLAAFQLGTLDAPEQAADTIRGALYLNPQSQASRQLFLDSRARQREKAGRTNPG